MIEKEFCAKKNAREGIAPSLFAVMIDAMGFGLVYPMMTAILTSTSHPIISPEASLHLRHFYLGLSFLLYPLGMFLEPLSWGTFQTL